MTGPFKNGNQTENTGRQPDDFLIEKIWKASSDFRMIILVGNCSINFRKIFRTARKLHRTFGLSATLPNRIYSPEQFQSFVGLPVANAREPEQNMDLRPIFDDEDFLPRRDVLPGLLVAVGPADGQFLACVAPGDGMQPRHSRRENRLRRSRIDATCVPESERYPTPTDRGVHGGRRDGQPTGPLSQRLIHDQRRRPVEMRDREKTRF